MPLTPTRTIDIKHQVLTPRTNKNTLLTKGYTFMHQKNNTGIQYAAVFKSLFRLYTITVFGISRWQDFIRKSSNSRNKQEQAVITVMERADGNNPSKGTSSRAGENEGGTVSIVKTGLFILFLIYITKPI